ncbi:MAG: DNA topoisomerase IB [Gemmatimonadaceae bacterium]|nr:DNA topoisomerase IB [Gemmatimonadaceae bacterium]
MPAKWILRKGTKKSGFGYEDARGKQIKSREVLERIDSLRIPPAWKDVHVAATPRSAIQVWGFDARGRKQYRYHPRAVEKGELRKHYRVRQMARDLPSIRSRVSRDFRSRGHSSDKVCAGIVRLIGDAFFRVGSDRYAKENNSFGITTLRKSHVQIDGDSVHFRYRGKKGVDQWQVVTGQDVVRFVRAMMKTPGPRLFRYQEGGKWRNVEADDVNDYLRSITDFPYTVKDFRTWGGTLRAATVLAELGPAKSQSMRKKNVLTAVRLVAAELGNTPTICRKSYVHPVVLQKYLRSAAVINLESRRPASTSSAHSPEEGALIEFLDAHFPERRKERRVEE